MHRGVATIAAYLCWLSTAVRAQVHQEWVQTHDTFATGQDHIYAVAVAPSGWICAVGKTGDHDALVLRYEPSGSLAWSRISALGTGIDLMYDAVIDPSDESIYVVGRGTAGSSRGVVLKYDAQGNLLWSRSFGVSPDSVVFYQASLRPNGNLITAGTGPNQLVVVEYDAQGNLLWDSEVPGGDYVSSLRIDPFGNIVVAGPFDEVSETTLFGVAKLSPTGTLLWSRSLSGGGSGLQSGGSLAIDPSGAIYASGRLFDGSNVVEAALVKLDPLGNVVWTQTHQGTEPSPEYYEASWGSAHFAPNGNIRVAGNTANSGSENDIHVAEFTASGQLVWQNAWNSPANGPDTSMLATSEVDGSLTVLVKAKNAIDIYEPVVLRWNPDGSLRWADIDPIPIGGWPGIYFVGVGPGGLRIFAGRIAHNDTGPADALVVVGRDQALPFGFGDGSSGPCPCGNSSTAGYGQGCRNSAGTAASLHDLGEAVLAADTLVLVSQGVLPSVPCVLLQGNLQVAAVPFGDGVLTIGGNLTRLFVKSAQSGSVAMPSVGDPSISARSATLGDPISAGTQRFYRIHYRDPDLAYCPAPLGSSWNSSSALQVRWAQ